jgi:hypothetical protein
VPRSLHARSLLARLAAFVAVVVALAWTFASPPAVANGLAPIQIDATDEVGDAVYFGEEVDDGADITGFSILQDRAAGTVSGTVSFAGNVTVDGRHELRVGLGLADGYGCNVSRGFGWVHIRHDMGSDRADYVIATNTDIRRDVAIERPDGQVKFTTPAGPGIFDGRGFRCIVVTTERLIGPKTTDGENPQDRVVGYAPAEVEAPQAVADPGKGIPAPILDADGDGVHDGADKCPKLAGAATNGCETATLAKSIRLGTKRVVIDRLLASTSGTCPKTVKAVVSLKGKTLGKQTMGTIRKGKFCHVFSVVKLKKRVAKARVVIRGTGITPVAATVVK